MTTIPKGKGYWTWLPYKMGSVADAVDQVFLSGATHVVLKVADAQRDYFEVLNVAWEQVVKTLGLPEVEGGDYVGEFITELEELGIDVWGYQYSYRMSGDGAYLASLVNKYDLAGGIADIEREWKAEGSNGYIKPYIAGYRNTTDKPLGYSSYRYPTLHSEIDHATWLKLTDFASPQVYWEQAHNPRAQLERCVKEITALHAGAIIVPSGSLYVRGDWYPYKQDIIEFEQACADFGLQGCTYWTLEQVKKAELIPAFQAAFEDARLPLRDPHTPPPPPPTKEYSKWQQYQLDLIEEVYITLAQFADELETLSIAVKQGGVSPTPQPDPVPDPTPTPSPTPQPDPAPARPTMLVEVRNVSEFDKALLFYAKVCNKSGYPIMFIHDNPRYKFEPGQRVKVYADSAGKVRADGGALYYETVSYTPAPGTDKALTNAQKELYGGKLYIQQSRVNKVL